MDIQNQPPFLLCKNQRQAISGFWFYCKEDCIRIHGLLERLIKKCNNNNTNNNHNVAQNNNAPSTSSIANNNPVKSVPIVTSQQQQPPQVNILHNTNGNAKHQEVDIFSMLSKAQAEFSNKSNVQSTSVPPPISTNIEQQFAEMKMNQQHQQQPLMKQLSNAMPNDITSPNVVSFFAAAQQPVVNGAVMEHPGIIHGGAPQHYIKAQVPNQQPRQIVKAPIAQTLDEIEKQHRVSSISPKNGKKIHLIR